MGLLVPELTNPIFPAFAQVIETALVRHGFTPVLCTHTPGGVHEDDYVQMLLDRGVAGIIYVSGQHADTTTDPRRYVHLRDRGLPIVLVNGFMPDIDAPFVSNDDEASMELSLSHLVHLGHSRIGLAIGPPRYVPSQRKIAGYRRFMSILLGQDDVDDFIATEMYTVEGGQAAASRLLEHGCTAIVCGSDLMALGAVRGVRAVGMRVPEEHLGHRLRRLDPHRLHRPATSTTVRQQPSPWARPRSRVSSTRSSGSRRPARSTSSVRRRRARVDRRDAAPAEARPPRGSAHGPGVVPQLPVPQP